MEKHNNYKVVLGETISLRVSEDSDDFITWQENTIIGPDGVDYTSNLSIDELLLLGKIELIGSPSVTTVEKDSIRINLIPEPIVETPVEVLTPEISPTVEEPITEEKEVTDGENIGTGG